MNKYERIIMTIKKLLYSTFFLINILYAETSGGINANKNDVELFISLNFNTLASYADGTTYILDIDYLHSGHHNMSQIGFSGENNFQGIENLILSLGIKGIVASDFLAFPIFTKASYKLPLIDEIPTTSLIMSFAYAPKALSLRDARRYVEWRIEADMEIIPNVHAFTGYRNIDTEYDNYDKTFNNSFYLGMKLSF